jgi:ABC-type antimicrobial peptide transport system permease subunit
MAYTVARRTREVGIRIALGAPRRGVVWLVLREVIQMGAAGLLAGSIAAFALLFSAVWAPNCLPFRSHLRRHAASLSF